MSKIRKQARRLRGTHARGRLRDREAATARRNDRPICAESGKRVFAIEADVYLAFRGAEIQPRAYRCPFCGGWHGSSTQ